MSEGSIPVWRLRVATANLLSRYTTCVKDGSMYDEASISRSTYHHYHGDSHGKHEKLSDTSSKRWRRPQKRKRGFHQWCNRKEINLYRDQDCHHYRRRRLEFLESLSAEMSL